MGKVVGVDPSELINAVRIWTGWGGIAPNRDDARLMQRLGTMDASVLLPVVKQLEEDFYASDAHNAARDLEDMAKLAKEHFARMHPTVPAEVGKIFAWCYTFDYK
jgi:hypothetical protein